MTTTKETSKVRINRSLLTIIAFFLLILIWIGVRLALPDNPTPFAGTRPDNIGVVSGKLVPCPSSPNCVSSQSQDASHYIEPLKYEGSASVAINTLKRIIESQERTKIIAQNDNYLYAEFASQWMGFVDDVEFYVNKDKEVIEVRSASRLGEGDLGVNRQRIESIRSQF